ncbi:MAG: FkbM family methyltransferase [Xenococcaceae cyanobacterium]
MNFLTILYIISQFFSRLAFKYTGKQLWTRFPWAKDCKLPSNLLVTTTQKGYPIKISDRGFLASQIYWTGCFELGVTNKLNKLISPGDFFVDAGANVGYFSIIAGHLVSSSLKKGKVLAFEPCTSTFKALNENIHFNALQGVVDTFKIGLGNEAREKYLHISVQSELNTFSKPHFQESSNELVKIQPLDDFYELFTNDYQNCIVKIDVEGLEQEVLQGSNLFLKDYRTRYIIIESFSDFESIKKTIENYGFSLGEKLARATWIYSRNSH